MTDRSESKHSYAAYILGQMGPKAEAAVPDLLEALREPPDPNRQMEFRIVGLNALTEIAPDVAKANFRAEPFIRSARPR